MRMHCSYLRAFFKSRLLCVAWWEFCSISSSFLFAHKVHPSRLLLRKERRRSHVHHVPYNFICEKFQIFQLMKHHLFKWTWEISPVFLPSVKVDSCSGLFIRSFRLHSQHFYCGRPHEKCMSIIKMHEHYQKRSAPHLVYTPHWHTISI